MYTSKYVYPVFCVVSMTGVFFVFHIVVHSNFASLETLETSELSTLKIPSPPGESPGHTRLSSYWFHVGGGVWTPCTKVVTKVAGCVAGVDWYGWNWKGGKYEKDVAFGFSSSLVIFVFWDVSVCFGTIWTINRYICIYSHILKTSWFFILIDCFVMNRLLVLGSILYIIFVLIRGRKGKPWPGRNASKARNSMNGWE